jgi:hypothetical protein
MSPWVRYRRRRAWYSGAIARAPFAAWLATPEGRAMLDETSSHERFPWFAKRRAARRLWRQLAAAARDPRIVTTVQHEVDRYLARLQAFAYADGLPRVSVGLHRIVAVPRVLINDAEYAAIASKLRSERTFTSFAGDVLRDFIVRTLVDHLDGAIAGTRPSPTHALAIGKEWISVGVDAAFVWRLPLLNEPPWNGHHYLVELTCDPITRSVRKAVVAAIARMEASLPSLSRVERIEMLRRAVRGTG